MNYDQELYAAADRRHTPTLFDAKENMRTGLSFLSDAAGQLADCGEEQLAQQLDELIEKAEELSHKVSLTLAWGE